MIERSDGGSGEVKNMIDVQFQQATNQDKKSKFSVLCFALKSIKISLVNFFHQSLERMRVPTLDACYTCFFSFCFCLMACIKYND